MGEAKRMFEPETEELQPPPVETVQEGWSQDELVHEFVRLDSQIKELDAQRKDVRMALAGIAFENKADQNTVHIQSSDGKRIRVEFGIDYEYDNEQMFTASNLLGKDKFDNLFSTEVKFKARARNLKLFMNTVPSGEEERTAQQVIRDATLAKPRYPYVCVEKSK